MRERNGRYYLTLRDVAGVRSEIFAGKTLTEVERTRALYGELRRPNPNVPRKFAYDLHRRCRAVATRRGLPFDLSPEDVVEMIEAAGGCCPLTRIAFDFAPSGKRFRPWAPSIDRIQGAAGYVRGNCRVVCAYVNLAINEFGEDVFYMVAERALSVRRGRKSGKYRMNVRYDPARADGR